MRTTLTTLATGAALVLAIGAAGCSATAQDRPSATPIASSAEADPGSAPLLDEYGLGGLDAVDAIDRLDRLTGDERPAELMASVRPRELQLSSGEVEQRLPIPEDRFYVSVAPYVDHTHECFYHSLTTCKGELLAEQLEVRVTDETNGKVLVDESRTTFGNGFVGLWLPRDIEGTIEVRYGDKSGQVRFATDEESPTCVTTLRLT